MSPIGIFNIFVLIVCVSSILAQPFPKSPCPNIFKYLFNGENWYGSLELTKELRFGDPNNLVVTLGYSKIIPFDSYLGRLDLEESREDTITHILKDEPVRYKVNFPLQRPLPLIINIILNGNIMCELTRPINGYSIRGHVKLEHTLYTQLAAQKLAAAGIYPPTRKPHGVSNLIDEGFEAFEEKSQEHPPERLTCGQINPHFYAKPLILGGKTISRGSWPWLAAIYINLESLNFICGGNLISEKAILTAAHCFHGKYSTDDYIIMFGRHDISDWNEKGSIARGIEEVVFYPDYTSDQLTFDADIAVVLLRNVVKFTPYIQPVCLPAANQDIIGERGILVGWGQNQDDDDSTKPKRVEVNIVSDADCLRSNSQFRLLTSNRTFCAGNRDGSGPCSGDSGSGLIVKHKDIWTIVGLVSAALSDSHGNVCNLNEFVIYGDVRKFLEWIYNTVDVM